MRVREHCYVIRHRLLFTRTDLQYFIPSFLMHLLAHANVHYTSNSILTLTLIGGAAIAQWIFLRLPSCHPGLKSQAHHLCFFQFILFKFYICQLNWNVKRTKINKKRPRLALFKKTKNINRRLALFKSINIIVLSP